VSRESGYFSTNYSIVKEREARRGRRMTHGKGKLT
jgi:hypothetical protein